MSITRYVQKNNDGTFTLREIEEKTIQIMNLEDAILSEMDESRRYLLEQARDGKTLGLTQEEIDLKISEQKDRLKE